MTRVVLVDDHPLVRAGLRTLLQDLPGIEVVAEAGDGGAGLDAVRAHRPDLLITDVAMQGMNGLELVERARAELPALRVIVLSTFSSDEYVMRALRAGASAYLLKDAATAELELALDAAARGQTYLSPGASQRLVARALAAPAPANPLDALTPRQCEILKLIAAGVHAKEIGYRLNISAKTVDAHRAQIMQRLDIYDVAGLVRFAVRAGLVAPDD